MSSVDSLVSVIIPAFNRVKYIDQAVQSVLSQSHHQVELIVVDDGSDDGTYERLLEYGEKLKLLTHENRENRGQSAAINKGLQAAHGQYIAILDSDDYWHPDKLEKQVACFDKTPEAGLVYANGYRVNSQSEITAPFYLDDHKEMNDPNTVLLDCYMLLPINSLVRKSVYDEVGLFEESFRAAQDHDMLIRIAEVTQFEYLPEHLFYYRQHGESISTRGQELRWKNGFKILNRAKQRYPYKAKTIRKRLAVVNFRLGLSYWRRKSVFLALWFFLKAGILDPFRAINVVIGKEIVRG